MLACYTMNGQPNYMNPNCESGGVLLEILFDEFGGFRRSLILQFYIILKSHWTIYDSE